MTLFALADRMRRTVAELEATLSFEEYLEWLAFYRIRSER